MTAGSSLRLALAATAIVLGTSGCERDLDPLGPAPFPSDAGVFLDGFGPGVTYQAFLGSKVDALDIDKDEYFQGTASLKITVPGTTDPSGGFAGGAFVNAYPRDLSGFNALTFWAKASTAATFNLGGLGNDNTGTSRFVAAWNDIPLSTTWTKYVIPIPDPARLEQERGLFQFADGSEYPVGYEVWIDELQFEKVGTIAFPQPSIPTLTINEVVGATLAVQGTQVTYDVNGKIQTIQASPAYFTFASSNPSVATVDESGTVQVVGEGTAVITAKLGAMDATGALTIQASVPPPTPAPTPDRPAAEVISLFSDAYSGVPVDTWSAVWDMADVADVQIAGNNTKRYTNLVFAGVEFTSQLINASAMTHLHLDVWVKDASAFRIKLVDFGADGAFGGGDDSEHEITLSGSGGSTSSGATGPESAPPISAGTWSSVDIPLSEFTGLTARGHLAQMILSGSSPTVYLDNIYFYREAPTGPTEPAPTPTVPAAQAISMFSNAYTNVTVDTWSAVWDAADLEDVQIAGNDTKKYTNLVFAGIEATSQPIDASAMTRFHMDFWTPDPTAAPAAFRVKLVDFGADGAFGGGDDVEHELSFDATTTPALATGEWVALDVPLSAFAGMTTRSHVAQLIISGDPNTVYLDNVYFYTEETPTEPTGPAPTPTLPAANVVSLYSNAYTNVTVDTWSAGWDAADLEDVQIAGNDTKKYTNLVFAGVEFTSQTVDASAMTHFHFDLWTPDPTAAPAVFKVKLVDFGADGAWSGGDDVEHELTLNAASTTPLATGTWVSYDIPLSDFVGLTTRAHLAQLIISGDPNTVFLDNLYFHN